MDYNKTDKIATIPKGVPHASEYGYAWGGSIGSSCEPQVLNRRYQSKLLDNYEVTATGLPEYSERVSPT